MAEIKLGGRINMSNTYLVTYSLDNERYSVYLNAQSPEDAGKEILARTSNAVIEQVTKKGRQISER